MSVSFPVEITTVHIGRSPQIQVFYPRVVGMQNQAFQRSINHSIIRLTQDLIDKQVGDSPSTVVDLIGYFEVKNNQRDVLSLSLTNYTYHYHAAHGMTYIKSLSFDMKEEKLLNLSDLFKPGSNYVKRISDIIQRQITERDIFTLEPFTQIAPNQDFYMADKTLVIYFQLYELTAYAFGFPMFPISVYELQDIIREDGPLGRLMENN
jgi:hypothetical protein